jgi:chromosome segregation ATPase
MSRCVCVQNDIGQMEGQFEDMRRQIRENDRNVQQRELKKSKYEEEYANLTEMRAKKGKEPPDLNHRIDQANAQVLDLSKKVTQKHQQNHKCKQDLRAVESEMQEKHREVIFIPLLGKKWGAPNVFACRSLRERERLFYVVWCGSCVRF